MELSILVSKRDEATKKSIIAIARMMLVSIYHMILTETFNPSDYESFKNPKPPIKATSFNRRISDRVS